MSVMFVVCIRLPEVPVIMMVAWPTAAVLDAVSVSTLEVVATEGLKDAVTPAGRPLAERVTAPLKSFRSSTVMVLEVLLP